MGISLCISSRLWGILQGSLARPDGRDLMGEVVERRLESLAKAMRRRYRMKADG